jgi:hypothetical protein
MSRRWTRTEKQWLVGIIISIVVSIVLALFVPEIRKKLGLENKTPPAVTETHAAPPVQHAPSSDTTPEAPKPKASTKNQSSKTKVSGKKNVAGNNTQGSGNAVGNGNQVTSPTLVVPGSGNAISFGQQGGITAGTVNVSPPPAHVKWEAIEGDELSKLPTERHPRSFAKIYVDQSLPDAKFAVVCDRPCKAVWNSSVAGPNFAKTFSANDLPNVAGFMVVQPNPFPSFTNYILGIESQDDSTAKILDVGVWNLTDEQKKSLLQ